MVQAKASLDAVRAAAATDMDHAAQRTDAIVEERDRSLEQVNKLPRPFYDVFTTGKTVWLSHHVLNITFTPARNYSSAVMYEDSASQPGFVFEGRPNYREASPGSAERLEGMMLRQSRNPRCCLQRYCKHVSIFVWRKLRSRPSARRF